MFLKLTHRLKKSLFTTGVLWLVLLSACNKDLDMAEWVEVSVVYGIINAKDTVQYIRINRLYSCADDPMNYTQINDSVNYPDNPFDVFLEEYIDKDPTGNSIQYEAVDRQKEPGLFSSASNCVYRTEMKIRPDHEYRLRVVNRESGKECWGDTRVLGHLDVEDAFSWERAFYRVDYSAEPLPEFDGSLNPDDHEHYIVRFLYWEYTNGETYYKYVDWLPTFDPLKDCHDDDTTYQLFDNYFEYLSEQIPVDPNVKRKARGVDYMLALPGSELQNFMTVYEQPTNPHFYPDYSNLHDGKGVFGSKYYYTYFGMKLRPRTIDSISWGKHLVNHRFADSNGEWH